MKWVTPRHRVAALVDTRRLAADLAEERRRVERALPVAGVADVARALPAHVGLVARHAAAALAASVVLEADGAHEEQRHDAADHLQSHGVLD